MRVPDSQLKTFILDSGLVSRRDVESAEKKAKEKAQPLGDILISSGAIGEEDVRRLQAHILGMPFVPLTGMRIDSQVLSLIPEPIARTHNAIAYKKGTGTIEVAMLDMKDLEELRFIEKKTGLKIVPRLTDAKSIKSALLQYQKFLKGEFGDFIRSAVSGGAPEKALDALLRHALLMNASDIHIEPTERSLRIRYRLNGTFHDAMELPSDSATGIAERIKKISRLDLTRNLPQEGRFRMEADGESSAFRVSIVPTHHGDKIVLRVLREGAAGFTLESLGFHGAGLEKLHNVLNQRSGMILVAGPAHSGKTTTLYTLLDIVNAPDAALATVEEAIEYQMPRVSQTEARPEAGFALSDALRAALRQDPDVIMIGEIKDAETVHLAFEAARRGILVLAGFAADSAPAAISKLIEMNAAPELLTSALRLVVSQRLVRQLCPDREARTLSDAESKHLGSMADMKRVLAALQEERRVPRQTALSDLSFYKPTLGGQCADGYGGEAAIHEVLPMTRAVRELVMKGASVEEMRSGTGKESPLTLVEDGIFKAAAGVTTIEEVLRVTNPD